MSARERRIVLAAASACAALFLALACPRLTLPAPSFQEGMHVLPALTVLKGRPLERDLWTTARVAGRPVFLGLNEYTGSLETYPLLALFRAAGAGVTQWRLFALALVLLAWLAFAWLAAEAFGARAALPALALLVSQPALLAAARAGLENEFAVLCLTAGVAGAAYFRWQNTGAFRWLALGAFALGVGCWEKIVLFQLAAAGLLAHALFSPRRAPLDAAWFWLLGLAPLLAENVLHPFWTVRFATSMMSHPAQGAANSLFMANLGLRLGQAAQMWAPPDLAPAAWARWWLPAAALLPPLAAALVPAARRRLSGRWLALAAFVVVFLPLSAVNGTGLRAYQLQPAMPFVLVLSAQALCALLPRPRALAFAAAALVAAQAVVFAGMMRAYARTGGFSAQSAALYDVADFCRARWDAGPIAVRGAVAENLEAVSRGAVVPLDAARFGPDEWTKWLGERGHLYILPAPGQFAPRPLDEGRDFEAFARKSGFELRAVRVFENRVGAPIYIGAEAVPLRGSARRVAAVPAR